MISKTTRKLDEAGFFLGKLKKAARTRPKMSREVGFYLSAFVSAARSVPWIMQHEYAQVTGWKEWYDAESLNASDEQLLRRFRTLRNQSQKEEPLDPGYALLLLPHTPTEPEVPPELGGGKRMCSIVSIRPGPSHDVPVVVEGAEHQWLLTVDGLEGDLVEPSERYLNVLTRLVTECEARFDVPRDH